MALSFPLPISNFFEGVVVESLKFELMDSLEIGRTGNGQVLSSSRGDRLWRIDVGLSFTYHHQQSAIEAKIDVLREPGRSLLVYPKHKPYPSSDPNGAVIGLYSPTVVSTTGREIVINNLSPGFVISAGDFLSIQYGSSPLRYGFHRVVVGGTANGSGVSPSIEVSPPIRSGVSAGDPVNFSKPECKAVIIPGTVNIKEATGVTTEGPSFSLIQTFRA